MRINIVWSSALASIVVCFCLMPADVSATKKKNSVKTASIVIADAGEIDRRIQAAEAEILRLNATLTQLIQDSIRASGEMAAKLQSVPGSQLLEGQPAQKTQEIANLRQARDKARQDSITVAAKLNERYQGIKREATRLDAAVIAASKELNALSSRQEQIPTEGTGEGTKAAKASKRELAHIDSLLEMKQADLAALARKHDKQHQDSIALEVKISEGRIKLMREGRRIDSLLQIASAAMNRAVERQAKIREGFSNVPEKAKLDELSKQKSQVEAQIVQTQAELAASMVDRDRLRAASADADKKIVRGRAPLVAALANAEKQLSEKANEEESIKLLKEKILLDSAIVKAKDALNSAIQMKAMKKKGADKLVNQHENEISTLMGRMDDIIRKNPQVTQYETKLGGAMTSAEKRKRINMLLSSTKAEIASLTARRDQAESNLDNYDKTHPSTAKAWAPRIRQLDSTMVVKEKTVAALTARRDPLESQIAVLKHKLEGINTAANAEGRKADSLTAFAKKQWSDLSLQRAQVRGDSLKNESTLSVGLMRLRSDQAKVGTQVSALEREIASMEASKERLKQAIVSAQNREEQAKIANQAERKRLDSLINTKEKEVTQLSLQNEKVSQELQSASRDREQELQKQEATIASITAQITKGEQDLIALKRQAETARKDRVVLEKSYLDTIKSIGRTMIAVRASIDAQKNEIATLKNQRTTVERNLKREIMRLDSLIAAEGRNIAGLESNRDKTRRDSATAESSKSDAALRSAQALKRQDSLITDLQNELKSWVSDIEKARQDSVALSAPLASVAQQTTKTIDSLIACKEREIAELRQQREKVRQEALAEKQKQSASLSAAHENIMDLRMMVKRKKAELASLQSQRGKLQSDSSAALARIQSAVQSSGTEIARQNAIIAGKKEALAAMQIERSEKAKKLKAMGEEPPIASSKASSGKVGSGKGNAETAKKIMEEIYTLIGSDRIDEAVSRFNSGCSLLLENLNSESFQVLKYAVDQAAEARKKSTKKK